VDVPSCDQLLTTTRAVRRWLDFDRPVPLDVVRDCIRIAIQAPTGANLQGWRFVVVTEAAKRERLAEIYRNAEGGRSGRRAARLRDSDPQSARVYESADFLVDALGRVPVHVVPCIHGRVDGASNATAAPFYGSILPAVWSFMLALRARGLGSVWTTAHLDHEREAAELLNIPEGVTQVALIPVAYMARDDFGPAKRRPLEEVLYIDGWPPSA